MHSQSRFARNTRDLLTYKEKLERAGVALLSITQEVGAGSSGDFVQTILGAGDELQSAQTGEHVARSMIENARLGFWNGSKPPFGFRTYVAEIRGARNKKRIEIDDHEAEIVRLIFQLYTRGAGHWPLGIKALVDHLNSRGHRNRQGKLFRVQFVGDVLRNTAYMGEHYFKKRDRRR